MIRKGRVESKYTSTGKHYGYTIELYHEGLKEYKHLSGKDNSILEGKIHNQNIAWKNKWAKHLEKTKKDRIALDKQEKDEHAQNRTQEAKENLLAIEKILNHTISVDNTIDWDSIKNNGEFLSEIKSCEYIVYRKKDGYPEKIKPLNDLLRPRKEDYFKKISVIKIIFGQKGKILLQQDKKWNEAIRQWEDGKVRVHKENQLREDVLRVEQVRWNEEKKKFELQKSEFNKKIDNFKENYRNKNVEAVVEYCEMVLNNSVYPDTFPKDFELQYNESNRMLLIDYELPSLNNIPNLTIVKYIKSRDEFEEKYLSHAAHAQLFDSAVYQIALRTLHEIFEADVIDAISAINYNGIVTDINPGTGHKVSNCIISIQAKKDEFKKINLASVVPKQCFKTLKGVGSSKLSSMTAIRPILELDKSDRRFKDHYNVAEYMDISTNLAAMDWEDFEHLIRELFEKEFALNGGEVKVTQASADGGVDAVAFDPDPIRGGKIVIQAKRYTNTVGVAAVRDLYGTVMNEGATKGILVTTADYGPDSYEFAKGKPLTLLSGSNLLHLLEKHGHKAKIDIKEARKILKETQKEV